MSATSTVKESVLDLPQVLQGLNADRRGSDPARGWRHVVGRFVGWMGGVGLGLGMDWSGRGGGRKVARVPSDSSEREMNEFADLVREAREPAEIHLALAWAAWRLSRVDRVDLQREHDPRKPPRRIACWPERSALPPRSPQDDQSTVTQDCETTADVRPPKGASSGVTLRLPIRSAGRTWGILQFTGGAPPFSPRLLAALTTLCTLAAAAERGLLASSKISGDQPAQDPVTGLHSSSILAAFLPHALAQARRRREALSILCIAADRLTTIREVQGDRIARSALHHMSRAVVACLRTSDFVARLDDDRIVVVLANAGIEDARTVAEALRRAIAEAGVATSTVPSLTASIGVACFPENATELVPLHAAAAAALTRAQSQGHDRVVSSPLLPSPSAA